MVLAGMGAGPGAVNGKEILGGTSVCVELTPWCFRGRLLAGESYILCNNFEELHSQLWHGAEDSSNIQALPLQALYLFLDFSFHSKRSCDRQFKEMGSCTNH